MEQLIVDEYLNALSKDWIIHKEVWGVNRWSKNKKRIDAIIVCKAYPTKIFGIEFKQDKQKSFHYFTHWFKQTIIYTQTEWDGFGKIPILMCPEINYYENYASVLKRIAGEFGIGELNKRILYNGVNEYRIEFKEGRVWCTSGGWNNSLVKTNFNKYLEL